MYDRVQYLSLFGKQSFWYSTKISNTFFQLFDTILP